VQYKSTAFGAKKTNKMLKSVQICFFFERKSQFKFVTKFSPRHAASSSMHDACVRITALVLGRLPF